ncbi:MAG: hypothetical protein O3C28_04155 [Proteobacteria bacterium]|nr:hypothetical protein [Pseudomonadota bacterium]
MLVKGAYVVLSVFVFLCAACAKDLTPQEVASHFWTAVQNGDAGEVRRYITAADALSLKSLDGVLPISNSTFERTVTEATTAYVDTTITVVSDKPLDFPLKTYLIREDKQWKVDYKKTISSVEAAGKLAGVISRIHEFGTALQEGIDRSVKQFEDTVPQIEQELTRLEEEIRQRVPELRERLDSFARELEKSLRDPPKNKAGSSEPQKSIAL